MSTESTIRPAGWLFIAAVCLVALGSVLRYLPHMLSFEGTLFGDPGWPVAVDALLDDGLVPTRDFGYFYGLLALPIDRAWFALLGRTPAATAALTALGSGLLAVGLIRFGWAAVPGVWPRVLFVAAVPIALMPLPYPTPLHAIEAALLVNALAFQARGRLAAALALVTVAVFIKPGLAYFHGLALVLLILSGCGGAAGSWFARLRTMLPAAVVGSLIAAGLAVWFGIGPLLDTQFPFRAVRNYSDENFGFFFGVGREFWSPEKMRPIHYLLLPAGFWLVATGWLIVGAVARLIRLREPLAATVITCAFLHVVFIVLLFGNEWSWLYYSAILVCGVCAVVADQTKPDASNRMIPLVLAVLAVLGMAAQTVASLNFLRKWEPSAATAGLYADPADAALWDRVRELGRHDRVMVFSQSGGGFVVFPEVVSPRSWFLLRSTATEAEIERVKAQLREADWLVVSKAKQYKPPDWPAFQDELKDFRDEKGEWRTEATSESFLLVRRAGRP